MCYMSCNIISWIFQYSHQIFKYHNFYRNNLKVLLCKCKIPLFWLPDILPTTTAMATISNKIPQGNPKSTYWWICVLLLHLESIPAIYIYGLYKVLRLFWLCILCILESHTANGHFIILVWNHWIWQCALQWAAACSHLSI